jgi:Coenzyme PQQ synthesis protein D (PqqD)
MQDTDRFRIDEPRVIGEVMEGELVLVHFETGRYYSVRGVSADVCQLLTTGYSVGETTELLATHFALTATEVGEGIRTFVAGLVAERVLVQNSAPTENRRPVKIVANSFEAPTFEKFDDMADQLLLDPIHEIDETGWPMRKTG